MKRSFVLILTILILASCTSCTFNTSSNTEHSCTYETVIETVLVPVEVTVPVEVVETVLVPIEITVPTEIFAPAETVIVEVEKEVIKEVEIVKTETVVVEKEVTIPVVETVVVEKIVEKEVVKTEIVEVEKDFVILRGDNSKEFILMGYNSNYVKSTDFPNISIKFIPNERIVNKIYITVNLDPAEHWSLTLYANGRPVGQEVVLGTSVESYTWENLDKYQNSKMIIYTVKAKIKS